MSRNILNKLPLFLDGPNEQTEVLDDASVKRLRERREENGEHAMTIEQPVPLTNATVQEIQLELIRRTQHNSFDGEQVHRDLLERRDLWEAVLLDRPDPTSLIKLRDLSGNYWNTDTLFILAVDEAGAYRLKELGEQWLADSVETYGAEATGRELGTSDPGPRRLVQMWWD